MSGNGMCILCAIHQLEFKAGMAYVIGTLMGERGLQRLAVASCEGHAEAVGEITKRYTEFADKYEKELLADEKA